VRVEGWLRQYLARQLDAAHQALDLARFGAVVWIDQRRR